MLSFAQEAARWSARKRAVFDQINGAGLPVVLFGSKACVISPDFLEELQVPHEYILDNDAKKWGSTQWGLRVISPTSVPYRDYQVLILVPAFVEEITEQLRGFPNPPRQIFDLDLYYESSDSAAYYDAHSGDIEEVMGLLSDPLSKETFQRVLHYRVNRDRSCLSPVVLPRGEQYFPAIEINSRPFLHNQEVFVDAGAYTGDTVSAFRQAVGGRYRAIYAFEPDAGNFALLSEACAGMPGVMCIQAGVGEREEMAAFNPAGPGSKVGAEGMEQIRIVALDEHLMGEGREAVTYLKMDVEGMEGAALLGAKRLIQTCRPKLAVCTYHSDADMLELPKLMHRLNPEYRLYFRHYTCGVQETVCYAV